MKCKYCDRKGVKLSHFPKKHGALLARRAAAARKKAPRGPGPRSRKSRSRQTRSQTRVGQETLSASVPDAPAGFVVETVTWRRA